MDGTVAYTYRMPESDERLRQLVTEEALHERIHALLEDETCVVCEGPCRFAYPED